MYPSSTALSAQQAQRPLRVPLGRIAAAERDEARLELAIRLAKVLRTTTLPVPERRLQTVLHEPLLHTVHSVRNPPLAS